MMELILFQNKYRKKIILKIITILMLNNAHIDKQLHRKLFLLTYESLLHMPHH